MKIETKNLPILYSLQHCPYAMRARMGILLAHQNVRLRAIRLNNKPAEMLKASAKGTVPVLVIERRLTSDDCLENSQVIDESLNIMLWALNLNDPLNLLYKQQPEKLTEMLALIAQFDTQFKNHLKKYKSAKRYHKTNKNEQREKCERYIIDIENKLTLHPCLFGEQLSLVDFALLPFIRQFSKIERQWFLNRHYPKLKQWLKLQVESSLFSKAMFKHPLWLDNHEEVLFGSPIHLREKGFLSSLISLPTA